MNPFAGLRAPCPACFNHATGKGHDPSWHDTPANPPEDANEEAWTAAVDAIAGGVVGEPPRTRYPVEECYVEFGCQVIVPTLERRIDTLVAALARAERERDEARRREGGQR